jgi:hypothetical protein
MIRVTSATSITEPLIGSGQRGRSSRPTPMTRTIPHRIAAIIRTVGNSVRSDTEITRTRKPSIANRRR